MYNAPDDVAEAPILPTEETVSFTIHFVIQSQFQRIRITAKQTNLQIASGIFAIIMGVMGAFSAVFKYSEAMMNACMARRRTAKLDKLATGGKRRCGTDHPGSAGRVTVTMPGGVGDASAQGIFEGSNPLTRKVRQQSIVEEWGGSLPSTSQKLSRGLVPSREAGLEEQEHDALSSIHTISALQWKPNPMRAPAVPHDQMTDGSQAGLVEEEHDALSSVHTMSALQWKPNRVRRAGGSHS
jgi:hypothetical protein